LYLGKKERKKGRNKRRVISVLAISHAVPRSMQPAHYIHITAYSIHRTQRGFLSPLLFYVREERGEVQAAVAAVQPPGETDGQKPVK
jgi:hypothetical protein